MSTTSGPCPRRPSRSGRCWPTAGSTPSLWWGPRGCATSTTGWPAVGTRLHHSFGTWPLLINDTTEVLEVEEGRRILLLARGWPAGQAHVEISLSPVAPTPS